MTLKNSLEVVQNRAFATNVVTYGSGKSNYIAEPTELLSVAQDVTTNWEDCGLILNTCVETGSSNNLAYLIDLDINDSEDVRFRIIGNWNATTSLDYVFSIYDIKSTMVSVSPEYAELSLDADQSIVLEFQTSGIPYIQLQVQAGTVGVNPCSVNSVHVVGTWK